MQPVECSYFWGIGETRHRHHCIGNHVLRYDHNGGREIVFHQCEGCGEIKALGPAGTGLAHRDGTNGVKGS